MEVDRRGNSVDLVWILAVVMTYGSGMDLGSAKMALIDLWRWLNDRLSILRFAVPKISKMDRTSILGDTIDYMKELLHRIKGLQEEMELGSEQGGMLSVFMELGPNEALVRNSPKFDVERRGADTRIEICCAAKPGLLLSTVTTLENLGLEIQQCVVSCFNDFGLQASCSEDTEQRSCMTSEEIKQVLFGTAGYEGKCM